MITFKRSVLMGILGVAVLMPICTKGQEKGNEKKKRKHELYFSWGYNKEWYTNSNLHVSQPSLGNDFTFESIKAHDHPGWNDGILNKAISIPQYNYRIGYFFNEKKGLAIEINFDHTKYLITDNQMTHIKGTMNGQPYDGQVLFKGNESVTADSSSYYYLNNGANFLLINLVKRWHLLANKKETIKIDGLAKAGIGPLVPHVQDKFFNQPPNAQHFQVGGWNIGVEGTLRATFYNLVYIEYNNKLDYARYSGLKISQGTARQAFGTYEMILNLGFSFPVGKRF